jgi:hypothetical protein
VFVMLSPFLRSARRHGPFLLATALIVAIAVFVGRTPPITEATLASGNVHELQVGGQAGVPADAEAVSINFAAVNAQQSGFITAYPCGTPQPTASTINYHPGDTIANSTIVGVGANGKVCIYNYGATDIIADITGWFPAGSDYTARSPERLYDSRPAGGIHPSGAIHELQVGGQAGVPADAEAVSINFAAVNAQQSGFITAYPCGTPQPTASTINYHPGDTIANSTIVGVGANGKVCIYNYGATDIIADITGWFPAGSDYTARSPERLYDSRPAGGIHPSGAIHELQVGGQAGVPADAEAVSINFAAVNAQQSGFITAYPCGTPQPTASTINYHPGDTIANSTIVGVGANGKVCIYNYGATDIIADITGWFPAGSDYTARSPERLYDSRPAANAEFVETFDGNGGLDRFLLGAYHRDGPWDGDTWLGDHDENCSTPEQKRTLSANDPVTKHVYVCKDHLMTSMGDVSGYSVVWFSPKGTNGQPMLFDRSEARTVSWDVNTTDLGLRQWVEVKILPEGAPPESVGDDFTVSGLPPYPAGSVVHGAGGGDKVFLVTDEDRKQFYLTYNGPGELQYPDRGTDLRTRYPMSMTDNGDGTITWTITDARGPQTFIGKGSFPERFQVVFADHNYTPDKDLGPLGTHTWHWDNIIIG